MNRTLVLVNITGLLIGISYGLHGPILPLFAKNIIGASYSELGFIGLANYIPYMFIPLFVGILLDRFNNGYLLSIGIIINSTSIYLLSIAQSVPEIMGFRVMTGIAHAFFWPPCESIITNVSSEKNRVRNISWFTMFFVIGFMIGPLLGSVIFEKFDVTYRIIFQITALILLTSIISGLLVSKSKIINHHEQFSISTIAELKKFPAVITLLVFCTASFGIILSLYPAFLDDNKFSDSDILFLYFIFGMCRVGTLALANRFSGKSSLTLISAAIAISLGMGISYFADSFMLFAISLMLLGFGFSIFFPLTLEVILSKTRKTISGKIIGAYETIFGIGWTLGPTIGGQISQNFGIESPYMVFCLAGIAVSILVIIRRNSFEPKKIQTI